MANNFAIGAGLHLDGEKEFKQAVSGINKDMAVLGSELGKVSAQFDGNANSMEGLRAKSEVYNKQIDAQKEKIELLKKALANSSIEYGENDKRTKDWQISLNKAEADLAKTENSLKNTTNQLDNFGKEADTAGDETKDAGKQAKASGDDAEKGGGGWAKFGEGLAKVGAIAATAVTALAGAATAAGSALVGMSVSGAAYADDVLTLSTQTGIATEKLQEYKYASELVDVSVETMTKSMAKQIKSMKAVQDGTKLSVEAYEKLGVQATNADGSLRDSQTVYWEIIDALGKMQNETERDAIAMQILGESAQELNPLIEAGSAKMQELGAQAKAAGYVLGEDALNQFGAFDDKLQFLKGSAEAAKNALGTILLPALTTLAGDGVDLLGQFVNGINGANGDVGKMVDVVSSTLTGVVDKIVEYLPQLIDAGMKILGALGQGLLDNLPQIIDAAITIVMRLVDGIIEALPQVIEGAMYLIKALADGLVAALPELIPAIIDTVLTIVETLIDNIDFLIDASIAIIMALATGLIDALPKLVEKIPVIIEKLIEAIVTNLPKLIEMGIVLVLKLAEGLIKSIPELIKAVPKIIVALVKGFAEFSKSMQDIGLNLIKGLWEGIKDAGAWLWEKISGFFGGVVDRIKDFFGIASPSKLFAGIGGYMAEGLGQGFSNEMVNVSKQMNKSVPTNFDVAYQTSAQMGEGIVNGLASVMGAPGGNYTINVTIDSKTIASVIFDPLNGVAKQRGVSFA